MSHFLKITKAAWILNVILLVLSMAASMAQAQDVHTLRNTVAPADLVNHEQLIVPNPDAHTSGYMIINNMQSLTAKVTFAWRYETSDVSPIYDMATYGIYGGNAVGLPIARGSRSQSGTATIEIGPYKALEFKVASDGADGGAQLGITVQSVLFPPTLNLQQPVVSLHTGIAVAGLQPVVRSIWDSETTPAVTFSIQPTLPAGLTMNADGIITGTPTTAQPAISYSVTATRAGATSSKDITIEVLNSVMASVDAGDVSVRLGGPISPVRPVLGESGAQTLSYSVSPALPSGLTMASATGFISGTPAAIIASSSYTVTVTDGLTSASKVFSLAVLPSADAPLATPDTVTWQAGVASEVTFAVRSDVVIDSVIPSGNPYRYGSLKIGGGPNLWGTTGYPSDTTVDGVNGVKFTWDNPIAGTYEGEVYFYDVDNTSNTHTIAFTLIVTGAKADQTITFTSTSPAAAAGGATYTPVAAATSALTVDFSIDSASTDICQISAGVVSFLNEGLCVINADQSGDGSNNPAPQVQQVVEVAAGQIGTALQTVSFTSTAPTPTLGGSDYTPTVTATSGLLVQLAGDAGSKSVCWPVGSKVILLAAGNCTVHAEQVGNFQYAPATSQQTFTIADAVVATQAIASQALSSGSLITPFTPITGANGVGPLTYAISPTLSEGLSFSTTTGEITGAPEAPVAQTTYTVTVSDANSSSDSKSFTLTITDGPAATLAIASKGLTINRAASFTPVTGAGGTGTLSYSIAPTLPANLSMSSSTGLITGTPNATGAAANYTVTVTDENSRTGSAIFSLTVNDSVVATQSIAASHVTQGFAAAAFAPVTGAGGTAALSYSVSPDLPAGLSMSSASGQISGTATSASSAATYTVTVTDANSATDTATFSLTVDGAVSATQAVATKALTKDAVVTAFTPVTGAGGLSPLTYTVSPDLPSGLVMASGTGEVSGTPTVTSSATTYTVTVTDANSATATATFSLTINTAVVATQAVAAKTLSANVQATAFTPVIGTGGTGPLAYSISPALPSGLDIDEDTGEISGSATAGSSAATYTVTVTDDVLAADTETFSLSVDGPVAATTAIATTQLPVNTEVTSLTPVTGSGGTGTLSYSVAPTLPAGLSMATGTGVITGIPTTPTPAATYTVTVTDGNSTTDTADFSMSVATIASSITLVASNTSPQPGETITLTATVTPSQAAGLVTFKDGGNAIGAPIVLVSGVATFSATSLANGTHTLTAEYEGSQTYQGSTSNNVAVSLLSPASEFENSYDEIRGIVQDLAVSSINSQVQNSAEAVRSATGRMIDNAASGSSIVVSSMNAPVEFHGEFNSEGGQLNADTDFFGQRTTDSGAKRRLIFGSLGVTRTDGGITSVLLNARMAWEWSASEKAMLGYWLGLNAGHAEIRNSFTGSQTSFGLGTGVYAIGRVGESIFVSGFASLGQDALALRMGNTVLDLTSDYGSQNQVIGTALTASIKRGRVELRPEFGLTYGKMDIGNVNFTGVAFGETDETLSMRIGSVSVATVSFRPEFRLESRDQETNLTVTPYFQCQKIILDLSSHDCGGGGSVSVEHGSSNNQTRYMARIQSGKISGVKQTSLDLQLNLEF